MDNVEQAVSTLHFADGMNNPERSRDTEGGGHPPDDQLAIGLSNIVDSKGPVDECV